MKSDKDRKVSKRCHDCHDCHNCNSTVSYLEVAKEQFRAAAASTMAFSPRFQGSQYRRGDVDVESPTTPSDRPLMYLSSSSGSSSFELESAPMLQDVEDLSGDRETRHKPSGDPKQRRRRRKWRFMRPYLPCIAFMVMAYATYFYISNKSASGEDPNSNPLSIHADIETKNNYPHHHQVVNDEFPESNPTLNPTETPSSISLQLQSNTVSEAVEKPEEIMNVVKIQKPKHNLVLHVGPQKTGSTTLQDAWSEPFGVLSPSLRQDHYRYRFIHPSSGFFSCDVNNHGGYINCEASPKLKGLIRTAKNDGQNLLLSDENLDDRFPETLQKAIDEEYWDVTVIVVYRRIHQWLVSWYDQINKTTNKDANGNILIDATGHPYRKEHTLWPDEGGIAIPTFSSWYKEFTRYWDTSELVSKHRSIAFRNAYQPYFKNIVVHNMHQEGDLMTNFMCDSVPDAPHSCNYLKNQTKRMPRDNKSVDLDYDILAVQAKESGVLRTTFKRKFVGSRIQKFVEETGKKIPRVCDMEVINEIRNWLFDSEKEMFQETWSEDKTSELEDTYNSYLESGKLCDIDFDQVFADQEWLDFFHSLDNRPHLVIHVGPQKTGSTTLQHVWAAPKELRAVMVEDNFDYYFINPHRGTFDCDLDGDRWVNCKASDKLKQILADASAQRKNLLLSDENLDERFAGALREAIDDNQFRVKVVLVYRRIHQWLPSWYSQINKSANKDSKGNLLRNEEGQPERQPHTKWPSEGGVYVPNFSEWYNQFVGHFHSSDLASNHPSVSFKAAYEPYFDHIEVYDMNQEGDFVTNFMCQMIPEATKTCHRLTQGSVDLPLSNPSVDVEHDIVSVAAFERGLIDPSLSRPEVVEAVQNHLRNSETSLPRRCDVSVRDEIHDWLMDSEKAMFPQAWSNSTRDALESDYNVYYERGKLCDIDIDAVLSNGAWIRFFASLGSSP